MKKIFLLLAISSLGFSEELWYEVKILGIKAGSQRISSAAEGDNKIRLISETKTNKFFSRFYKVDDYIEVFADKDFLPEYLFQRINEGRKHYIFEAKFNQKKKRALITLNGEEKEVELPEKTYDLLSLIYCLRKIDLYSGYSEEFCLITKRNLKRITVAAEEKKVVIKGEPYNIYEVKESTKGKGIKIWLEKKSKIPLLIRVPTSAGVITAILKR